MITIAAIAIGLLVTTKSDLNKKFLRLHPYHPYHPYHLDKNVTSPPSPVTSLSPLLAFFVSLGTLEPVASA